MVIKMDNENINDINNNENAANSQNSVNSSPDGVRNASVSSNPPGYTPYQPYNSGSMQYQPYGAYNPMPAQPDMFAVTLEERRNIKRNYFAIFAKSLIHGIGAFILAQAIFLAMIAFGYEFRYDEANTAIVDWIYAIAGSIPSILFCIGIFIYDKCRSKNKLSSYFRCDKISGRFIIGFFGMLLLGYSAATIIQNLTISGMFAIGISPIAEEYLTVPELNPAYLVTEVIFTAILAPVAEELMFRGVILRRLSSVSQTFAIFVSAAIFGLMHGNLLQTILGFVMGIILGYAAVKTGSLILPIAGHIFINGFATSTSFVQYFISEEVSNMYWTVALLLFGVIGLIALIALLAAGKIKFPEYTEYHRKRTFPIMLSCVSFWVMLVYYVISVISVFGPVTDKLME